MAVRLVRPRPLAGEPEPHHQPRACATSIYPLMTRAGYGIEQLDPYTNQVVLGGRGNTPENAGITRQQEAVCAARRPGVSHGRQDRNPRRLRHQLRSDSVLPAPARLVSAGDQRAMTRQRLSAGPPRSSRVFRIRSVPISSSGVVSLPKDVSERSPWGCIHRGYVQTLELHAWSASCPRIS